MRGVRGKGQGARAIFIAVCGISLLIGCGKGNIDAAKKDAPVVRATIDKKTVLIGDRIRYSIDVKARPGTDVELPKFADGKIGSFEIKDSGDGRYVLAAYSVGRQTIPPAEIKYRKPDTKDWQVVKTPEMVIYVESVLPKDGSARDIKDIKGPLRFFEIRWLLIGIFLAAIMISILGFKLYKRLKKRRVARAPHEVALEELKAIKNFLSKSGDIKEYYTRASDCIRRYIESAFKVRAPEMTTQEFLSSLKDSRTLAAKHKDLLKDFMEACDMVKFAKYAPTRGEIENILTSATRFVEETKPAEQEPEAKK